MNRPGQCPIVLTDGRCIKSKGHKGVCKPRRRVVPEKQAKADAERLPYVEKKCPTCDRHVRDWPMCFRGDDFCSVKCQKASPQ